MVAILPPKTNLGSQLGQSFGQGFNKSFEQQYERGRLQQALSQLREQGQNPNSSPTDLLYNLIEASSYSPEIGRNLPQLYAELNKAREASAMQNVNYGQGNQNPTGPFQGGISSSSQALNPENLESIRQSKFFPSNIGSQESPGNLPQEATQGQVRPVLSGDQLLQKTQQRQSDLSRNGIVRNFEDVYKQVENENEQNRVYNQHVENERQKRIQAQEKYGAVAEERLKKMLPGSSDEENAVFKKIGEDAAGQGKSEADIDRFISKEVSNYKNTLSNIEKNLNAPRIQNQLQKGFLGQTTDIKSVENDARQAVKPLIDLGLYEKARTSLANAGFYPEERERIIFGEMPKEIKQSVDRIPRATYEKTKQPVLSGQAGIPTGASQKKYDMKSQLDLFDNISKVWGEGENDKINLLQLRKAYEDKGYDWRVFKDSINELVNNGHIQLNDDQTNTLNSYLNNPPLNTLEKLLHGIGLRGR